jgi:hypothetical protein
LCFRFIIEYSSLRDFYRPILGLFLFYEDFWKMIYFGLCSNLRLVIIELWYLEGFWFLFEDFFFLKIIILHGEIFEFP